MQQNNLETPKQNTGFFTGGTIVTIIFLLGIYTFFDKASIAAKVLAAGGSLLSLVILIPFWITVFKILKS